MSSRAGRSALTKLGEQSGEQVRRADVHGHDGAGSGAREAEDDRAAGVRAAGDRGGRRAAADRGVRDLRQRLRAIRGRDAAARGLHALPRDPRSRAARDHRGDRGRGAPALERRRGRPCRGALRLWLRTVRRLRAARPDLSLTSDFIVGFPGETEEDFAMLLDWLDEAALDRVGCFKYEPVRYSIEIPHVSFRGSEPAADDDGAGDQARPCWIAGRIPVGRPPGRVEGFRVGGLARPAADGAAAAWDRRARSWRSGGWSWPPRPEPRPSARAASASAP